MSSDPRRMIVRSRRIVVKVGSALLAAPHTRIYSRISFDIAAARAAGREVVLVSSGAIALGVKVMGLLARPRTVDGLQAAAAAGQPELMRRWGAALKPHGAACAQVLLTHADLANRTRFLNVRRAIATLLEHQVVAVINENDSVATEEIRVGDNDQLSAQVAALVDADLLVILTSVDGLYSANPEMDAHAQRIAVVDNLQQVEDLAGDAGRGGLGVGGMRTKLWAARAATHRGIPVVVALGGRREPLATVLRGDDVGTLFVPAARLQSRKHWIGYTLKPQGVLRIDAGASAALQLRGKSLLARGLLVVEGEFERGCMVEVYGPAGVVGRGLVAYSAAELRRVAGRRSRDIATVLGYVAAAEVINRDDFMLHQPDGLATVNDQSLGRK